MERPLFYLEQTDFKVNLIMVEDFPQKSLDHSSKFCSRASLPWFASESALAHVSSVVHSALRVLRDYDSEE
jgi:hypothetical protein